MTIHEITHCRDWVAFCGLKRKELIQYLSHFGIVETEALGLVKNCKLSKLRLMVCQVMKRERGI
jgi:hypothetical protein